ncbi:MAG TPA: SGNH/GDSL hydrolase family protein [Candidatus Binatia bacterium]|nr:SGNH/GDSL hydrolase family protein [Candidatus Binatia bacterium]
MSTIATHATQETSASTPGRVNVVPYLLVLLQLGILALVIRQFQIESAAFLRLTLVAIGGFAVNALLPLSWRLPWFALLSLSGIGLVFGLQQGAWLVALGLLLIGICHIPIPFWARIAVLGAVAALLAVQRAEWLPAPWSRAIWPILGSMFMFRLVVYLYDLRHEQVPASPWRSLAYFFMLPNVCFPLFPVVDYKTFRRCHFDQDAYRTYQIGVDWMARGVLHLILYRIVYYHLTLAPSDVQGALTFAQYVLTTFLLYLRVSGQFHIIVGMLHLFGFRLPETHHRYFLASSFTDFWRRINIYWKDFMLKIFFNPLYFKLRRIGPTPALVISTIVVFFATWALHAYQWFWLRGSSLFVWTDVAFWSILATLVVVNAVYESRHGRARTLSRSRWTLRRFSGIAARTVGTFCTIALLWSLWTADSFSAWFALWRGLFDGGLGRTTDLGLLLAVAGIAAVRGPAAGSPGVRGSARPRWTRIPWSTAGTIALLLTLAALGTARVYSRLGPQVASFVHSLRSGQLSRGDTVMLERGYYEDLIRVDRFNSQLWEVYMNKPVNWLDVSALGLDRFTGDLRQKELVPSMVAQTRFGTIRTNRWGMRDREYERRPAPDTYRFALLGASTVMGWGVSDGETFESLVEDRLNRERAGAPFARYEILNFAVPGYELPQQLATLERALEFAPDAVAYAAIGRDLHGSVQFLVGAVRASTPIPYNFLRDLLRRAGVDASMDETTARRRLDPYRGEIVSWLFEEIARRCRERGAMPVLIFLPQTYTGIWEQESVEALQRAEKAGFLVLDLRDAFRGVDTASIRLADWDAHPNARGHQIMAAHVYDAITSRKDAIFVPREARQ